MGLLRAPKDGVNDAPRAVFPRRIDRYMCTHLSNLLRPPTKTDPNMGRSHRQAQRLSPRQGVAGLDAPKLLHESRDDVKRLGDGVLLAQAHSWPSVERKVLLCEVSAKAEARIKLLVRIRRRRSREGLPMSVSHQPTAQVGTRRRRRPRCLGGGASSMSSRAP